MTEQNEQDPHVAAAIEEEQRLLSDHMRDEQARYLLTRAMGLSAEVRRRDERIAALEAEVASLRGATTPERTEPS